MASSIQNNLNSHSSVSTDGAGLLQTRQVSTDGAALLEEDRLPLVPYPEAVTLSVGSAPFLITSTTQVILGEGVPKDELAVQTVASVLSGAAARDPNSGIASADGIIKLALSRAVEHPEGYVLHVRNESILLEARSSAGLLYGVQTLKQLATAAGSGPFKIPAMTITDKPRFEWRGIMLDASRHFFTAAQVKKLLDAMAAFKLNRFHWHLTDDQGWRLPVPVLPELTRLGARAQDGELQAYTETEIRDVVAYAKKRNIEIVPEVDVPGHAAAAIAAYPELGNSDMEHWLPPQHPIWSYGVQEYTMAPSPRVVSFLAQVFDRLAELFPGRYVHIGGDEAPTNQWQRSPLALSLVTSGLPQVQTFFSKALTRLTADLNRTAVGWDEIRHTGGLSHDVVIMAWRSRAEVVSAVIEGHRVVNADKQSLYFDHYQGDESLEPKAICCMTRVREVYEYEPMPSGLTKEQQRLVIGVQGQLWSEYFPDWHRVEYMAFPRTLAMAERAWTSPAQIRSFGEFRRRLLVRLRDLSERGIAYRNLDSRDV